MSDTAVATGSRTDTTVVGEILRRHAQLKAIRSIYEPVWHEIADFVIPRRSNWDYTNIRVEIPRLFSSLAIQALKKQSSGFQGYMVSRTKDWFELSITDNTASPDYQDPDDSAVDTWLKTCEAVVASELQRSNFYDAVAEYVVDAGSIGTATMFAFEDLVKQKAVFSTRHPKECWVSEGENGLVDTCYRQFRITYRQAAAKWPNRSQALNTKAVTNPYDYVTIIHAVQPREEWNPDSILATDKKWASYYVSLDQMEVLDESGFDEFPYFTWRWFKNSEETYGRSPAMDALTDILRLNQISRTQLELAQKIADPPLMVPETLKDSLRVVPGGHTYTQGEEKVEPMVLGENYPITIEIEQQVEKIINDHFSVNFFQLLDNIERQMTAREVMERKGEQAAVLGATIGSFQTEFLSPVIEWVFAMCLRQGKIPDPPDTLLQQGGHIDIEFTGYLAELQKKYYATSGITSALEVMLPIMQEFPDTIDNVDTDKLIRRSAVAYGLPPDILRTQPETQNLRKQKAAAVQAQNAQAAQSAMAGQVIAHADGLNQPIAPNSPLARLAQATSGGAQMLPGGR